MFPLSGIVIYSRLLILVVIYIETKASLGMGTYQLLEMVADQGRHVAVQQHRHLANLVVVWSDAVDL